MVKSVAPGGTGAGGSSPVAARQGGRLFSKASSLIVPAFSSGPEPKFDLAGSGCGPMFCRNAKPFVVSPSRDAFTLQPIKPPVAGGIALFCQTLLEVTPGSSIQQQLFTA